MMAKSLQLFSRWRLTRHAWLSVVVFIVGVLIAGATDIQAQDADALNRALDVYQQALNEPQRDRQLVLFRQAELAFEQIVDGEDSSHIANADLYVNLGNAALGAEHLGRALHKSHQGELKVSWSEDHDVCRVTWERLN